MYRTLWPAARVLVTYLHEHRGYVEGRRVLEVGAGTGHVGIHAAALGARAVHLTDIGEAVPFLRENIAACADPSQPGGAEIRAEALDWRAPKTWHLPVDTVLASDCVFEERLFDPLLATLTHLSGLDPESPPNILVCQLLRRANVEARFFRRAEKAFHVTKLLDMPAREIDVSLRHCFRIFCLTAR